MNPSNPTSPTNPISGIMHIHTNYSFDGSSSLEEVVRAAEEKGHSFLLISEHSDDFSDRKMEALVRDCDRLSSEMMVIIPGIEVHCDFGRHIVALGVREFIGTDSPDNVVKRINELGGLAIFPHPGVYHFRSFLEDVDGLHGVEVWNTRYDGPTAPNPKSFTLLQELREKNNTVFAFGGQDLHDVIEMDELCLTIEVESLSELEILSQLKRGSFTIVRKRTVIQSDGTISKTQRLLFDLASSARMVKMACGR